MVGAGGVQDRVFGVLGELDSVRQAPSMASQSRRSTGPARNQRPTPAWDPVPDTLLRCRRRRVSRAGPGFARGAPGRPKRHVAGAAVQELLPDLSRGGLRGGPPTPLLQPRHGSDSSTRAITPGHANGFSGLPRPAKATTMVGIPIRRSAATGRIGRHGRGRPACQDAGRRGIQDHGTGLAPSRVGCQTCWSQSVHEHDNRCSSTSAILRTSSRADLSRPRGSRNRLTDPQPDLGAQGA
jgi:hypothetical protein